jgi:hypothetical protein
MRSPFLLSLLVVLALAPIGDLSGARAEDEVDPAATLLDQIVALRKSEDTGGLAKAVAGVPEVYLASEDKSLKGKIRSELGKIVKDDDLGAARMAAVEALTALDDPKGAWKELAKALPGPKVEEAAEVDLAVVHAAGKLAQSRAVKPLTDLAYKAKDIRVAAAAAEALGGFREDKRGRVKILEELISVGRRTRPGQSTDKATSTEAYDRWAAVGPGVVKGLNALSGRSLNSFEDWEAMWEDHKKRPKGIFVE